MKALEIALNGARLLADPAGALLWPDGGVLAVADLHLEKGSSFARRGQLLPPYDSRATLARLAALVEHHRPRQVLLVGDSFHDPEGPARLPAAERAALAALAARVELVWIEGNHDPGAWPAGIGRPAEELVTGPLVFRHEARPGPAAGEVSGHFHPRAAVRHAAGRVGGRCFVTDGRRLILPAFGAFTGGLDVRDPAYRPFFPNGFEVVILGERRAVRFPGHVLA